MENTSQGQGSQVVMQKDAVNKGDNPWVVGGMSLIIGVALGAGGYYLGSKYLFQTKSLETIKTETQVTSATFDPLRVKNGGVDFVDQGGERKKVFAYLKDSEKMHSDSEGSLQYDYYIANENLDKATAMKISFPVEVTEMGGPGKFSILYPGGENNTSILFAGFTTDGGTTYYLYGLKDGKQIGDEVTHKVLTMSYFKNLPLPASVKNDNLGTFYVQEVVWVENNMVKVNVKEGCSICDDMGGERMFEVLVNAATGEISGEPKLVPSVTQ